jgi:hypothetical protein
MAPSFETRGEVKDVPAFYRALFKPVEEQIGKVDPETMVAIVGFPAGGPPNLSTVGRRRRGFTTYVTCELACYAEQVASDDGGGPYEVLVTTNELEWALGVATGIGRISFEAALGPGHTVDLGPFAEPEDKLKGVVLERFSTVSLGRKKFGILRAIGITRLEMEWARKHSGPELIEKLKAAGVHPSCDVKRRSIKL